MGALTDEVPDVVAVLGPQADGRAVGEPETVSSVRRHVRSDTAAVGTLQLGA